MDASQSCSWARRQPTSEELPTKQGSKCWNDDLNERDSKQHQHVEFEDSHWPDPLT